MNLEGQEVSVHYQREKKFLLGIKCMYKSRGGSKRVLYRVPYLLDKLLYLDSVFLFSYPKARRGVASHFSWSDS